MAVSVFAQEDKGGYIYHAEGEGFGIAGGDGRSFHKPGETGLVLAGGDLVQTGRDAAVELQIQPGAALIRIVENTSLRFGDFGALDTSMELLYGRLRIISGGENLTVKAGNVSVSLRQGDLGLDFQVDPGSTQPNLRVYVFSGAALLNQGMGGTPMEIRKGEALSVELRPPLYLVERKSLDASVIDYWTRHDFRGKAPSFFPSTELSSPVPETVEEAPAPPPHVPPPVKADRMKNAGILTGILLTVAGAALQGAGLASLYTGHSGRAEYLISAGFAPTGLGIVVLFVSLLHRSP
jgi:hypothetical protein